MYKSFIKDTKLPKWRAGRYFLQFGEEGRRNLSVEWTSGSHNWLGFRLKWGGQEQNLQIMVGLGLFTFWVTPDGWVSYKKSVKEQHTIGIMYYGGAITVSLWTPERLWGNPLPWWQKREWRFRPVERLLNIILGKKKYSTELLSTHKEIMSFPEGEYPVIINMEIATWKRPRWFAKSYYRPEMVMLKPIPFPGKGENSWDCGEDAVHSVTMAARKTPYTIKEVVELEKASILKSRSR